MKVLLLAYDLGLQGGVGTFNYELAVELGKRGIEVIIVTRGDKIACRVINGLKICTFPSPSTPPKDVLFYLMNMSRITGLAKRKHIDVIHDSSASIGFIPWLSKIAPVVVTVHGSPMLSLLRSIYGSFNDWVRAKLFETSHRVPRSILSLFHKPRVNKYVFVSKSCFADTLVHLPPEHRLHLAKNSCIIYNGISLNSIQKLKPVEIEDNSVIFIGRLMEYKGVARLIKAFSYVVKEIPNAKLHIIGSGPQLESLVRMSVKYGLNSKVFFHGWLNRRETLRILARSQILVHPSLYESFGFSIIEAYALGKPVVAHRAPYSIELVEGMGSGLTVNSFNERELANAITMLLNDSTLYKKLSLKAVEVAKNYFNIRKTALKYLKVYEEVLCEHP